MNIETRRRKLTLPVARIQYIANEDEQYTPDH